MRGYQWAILGSGWILWFVPFLAMKRPQTPTRLDTRARWGILLQAVGFAIACSGPFWFRTPAPWRAAVSAVFLALANVLVWTATRALGRQWRLDAGLNADHQLVRSGPYRVVRHPIYAGMFALLLGAGFMITPLLRLAGAVVVFVTGIEIRVRIEDALLASHFGPQFQQYRESVAAYLPLIR